MRFATKEYSNKPEDIDDKYRHITNFSVNKGNKDFVYNEKPGEDKTIDQGDFEKIYLSGEYEGHKWNILTLWKYFTEEMGIDWKPIWEATKVINENLAIQLQN